MNRTTLGFICLLVLVASLPFAIAYATCSCGLNYRIIAHGVISTTDDHSITCTQSCGVQPLQVFTYTRTYQLDWYDYSERWNLNMDVKCTGYGYQGCGIPIISEDESNDDAHCKGLFTVTTWKTIDSITCGTFPTCNHSGTQQFQFVHQCANTQTSDKDSVSCANSGAAWNFTNSVCSSDITTATDCTNNGWYWNYAGNNCQTTPYCDASTMPDCPVHYVPNYETCQCDYEGGVSPVLVDVDGRGFQLTDAAGGVNFDITAPGHQTQLAWTAFRSTTAWLVLDRNGNGMIDSGAELFGDHTSHAAA